MRDFAALIIIGAFIITIVMMAVTILGSRWATIQSPVTGACYEIRREANILMYTTAMSPVDDSYCEAE